MTKPWRHDCIRYSPTHKECKYETRGTISFELKDGKVVADLRPSGNQQGSSFYWPKSAVPYKSVDTTRIYVLEKLESAIIVGPSSRDWNDSTLLRIVDGSRILYDASICPLHHVVMNRQIEDGVSYEDYYLFREQYFDGESPRICPNDGKLYLACGSGIRHMTWRCPACYQISQEWRVKHGIN